MEVAGHAAIVTGGGSGMGAETARHLAAAGAKVALLDVNMDGANAVAKEIGGTALHCDVSDAKSAEEAIAAAQAAHGPARICINCAGVGTPGRIVSKTGPLPLEDYARVININLIGTFNTLRLSAAAMTDLEPVNDSGERGVIINTASVAAYEGQIGQAAYSSSKGGVVGLTLPAARELARFGIRVVTIAPGLMQTPMLAGLPEEAQKSLGATVPFPARMGRPDEYSKLALHIIDNTMLNGEVIRLDGAIRLAPR
ncbi:MAG: SDR family NAD(P)-dependent oxidoreductase [Gammaproteobacteria bacterium]|nr:SDR family NAD(P)-dependent oxidoreductase [Gammaproteobacteria bacterium]